MKERPAFVWHAHKDACDECSSRNGKTFRLYAQVPEQHPNCQCRLTYTGPKAKLPKRRGYRPLAVLAMTDETATHTLDIGPDDVHTDAAGPARPRKRPMAEPTTKTRKRRREGDKPKGAKRIHVRADIAHGGRLSVRHMADGTDSVWLEGFAVALSDDAKPVWIQLAKTGDFAGHPAGPFSLNAKVFDEIIANFRATTNRAIPVDFEHASEQDSASGSIPVEGAPAQGWIRDLKIQGGNLFGLVEWGDKAREYIRTGAYRYISPAIRFGAKDRVTGKPIGARLTSAGLTNQPFLDAMRPLAAKDAGGASATTLKSDLAHAPSEYMPRIKAALGMHELHTAAECSDHLERLRDHFDAAGGDPNGSHEGVELSKYMHPLRDAVGARPGDTWDEVFDAVEDLIDAAIDEHEVRDHGGASGASMTDEPSEQGVVTMGEQELTVKLTEANSQVVKLTDANAKLTETNAKMTLQLKDAESKVAALEGEVKTLKDAEAKRVEADITSRVDEAFATYKDKKALSEHDKTAMTITLKADPKLFEQLYPKVAPNQRHLMRDLTGGREPAPNTTDDPGSIAGETVTQTAKRLMKDEKISYADAQDKARRLHMRLVG